MPPQTVGLLGDVRHRDRRQVLAQPFDGGVALRVSGVRVVEPDHLQLLGAERDGGVPVAQHLGAPVLERLVHLVGARPVVVVPEHGDHRRLEQTDHLGQLIKVELAVADEVTGEQHEIGVLGVGHLDGGSLHLERRDAADVQVGEVRDPQMAHLTAVGRRPGEAAQRDAVTAGAVRGAPAGVRAARSHPRGPGRSVLDRCRHCHSRMGAAHGTPSI